jgi:hypothetical protein
MNKKHKKDYPMFFKLEPGRNYAYIFFVIVGLTLLTAFLFGENFGGIFFFLSFYYLGVLQYRSGVVLNRSWTAQYRKNNGYPTTVFLCFAVGTFGLLMLAISQK